MGIHVANGDAAVAAGDLQKKRIIKARSNYNRMPICRGCAVLEIRGIDEFLVDSWSASRGLGTTDALGNGPADDSWPEAEKELLLSPIIIASGNDQNQKFNGPNNNRHSIVVTRVNGNGVNFPDLRKFESTAATTKTPTANNITATSQRYYDSATSDNLADNMRDGVFDVSVSPCCICFFDQVYLLQRRYLRFFPRI